MHHNALQIILFGLMGLPLCTALVLAWSGSWRKAASEWVISTVTASVLWLCFISAVILVLVVKPSQNTTEFFRYDTVAAVFTVVTAFVAALTASFTRRYLHGDIGYTRFHTFLLVLAGGSFIAFSTTDNLAFIAGWECVGISSFLLIAYFYLRVRPRDHAVLVFACYRIGDAAIMIACALVPLAETISSSISESRLIFSVSMVLVAAACKSAQWPFSFWLPRAMEGPTPSSAVFYGGVSVHLGCFLLLRTMPLWGEMWWARIAIVCVGVASFVHGWIAGRTSSDVKTKLAHATIAHIGLVFIEIGLGWTMVALIHVAAHALVRTPQLLLASSALAEFLLERRTSGRVLGKNRWETGLPGQLGWRIYRYGLTRGNLEAWAKFIIGGIFEKSVSACNRFERSLERLVGAKRPQKDASLSDEPFVLSRVERGADS